MKACHPLSRAIQYFLILAIVLLAGWQLWDCHSVPYHPDESTMLFMSSDFELLFKDPTALTWQPAQEADPRQRYRELDAPITRYVLGLSRIIRGEAALPVDWDWSKDWETNRQSGALPSESLLLAGRSGITLLLPLSMLLLYLSGRRTGGIFTGLLAAILLGCNALVLLHTRRAMAEGALILGICLAMWGFLEGNRYPWLAGLGAAFAFNAKHSALALFPIGILAVCWLPGKIQNRKRDLLRNLITYLGVFLLFSVALNPLWWSNPVESLHASWDARQELLASQASESALQYRSSIPQRALVMIANLTIAPLAFYEVGNYRAQTLESEQAYLANPLHGLLRGHVGGGIFMVLALTGIIVGLRDLRHVQTDLQRKLTLLLLAMLAQFSGLLVMVPLSWQRYVISLIPFLCLWVTYPLRKVLAGTQPSDPPNP